MPERSVLICDDALFMRQVIMKVLSDEGFTVVGQAGTGAEAVEQFRTLTPDLVTMDVIMPDMGGIDAVKAIVDLNPTAKIVMCSGIGHQAMMEEAVTAGAKSYLVKPFQPEDLVAAVGTALA